MTETYLQRLARFKSEQMNARLEAGKSMYESKYPSFYTDDPIALARARRRVKVVRNYTRRYGAASGVERAERYGRALQNPDVYQGELIGFIPSALDHRLFVFQRHRCYMCAHLFGPRHMCTHEHVTPKSRGGRNLNNLLLACASCNNEKGDRMPTPWELAVLDAFNCNDQRRYDDLMLTTVVEGD